MENHSGTNGKTRLVFYGVALIFALLLLRTWPRLFYPEVWLEDGFINLAGFLARGLRFFTEPQNGYYFALPKIITVLSASVSVYFYPEITTFLTFIITLAIAVCIARMPLYLRGGFWLSILCFLIPTTNEAFGLPSYMYWWISLPLLAFIFWDERAAHRYVWMRIMVIGLASLTAPTCLITLPLYWARVVYFWKRPNRHTEIHIACWATVFTAIQLIPTWKVIHVQQNVPVALATLKVIVVKFFGSYVLGNLFAEMTLAAGIVVLLYIAANMFRHWRDVWLWALCYLWLAAILMSIARRNIHFLDPMKFGERYFFLPYILLGWLILQFIYAERNRWIRLTSIMLLVLSVVNTVPGLFRMRKPDDFRWRDHLLSCQHFSDYTIPVSVGSKGDAGGRGELHYAGQMNLSGEKCQQIARRNSFFTRLAGGETRKTFPYRVVYPWHEKLSTITVPTAKDIVVNQWQGHDYWTAFGGNPKIPARWEVFGSVSSIGHNNKGLLSIRLRRGDSLLYATGLIAAGTPRHTEQQRIEIDGHPEFTNTTPFWVGGDRWALLEFSSDLLPETFVVNFYNDGGKWNEWSAIAVKANEAAGSDAKSRSLETAPEGNRP